MSWAELDAADDAAVDCVDRHRYLVRRFRSNLEIRTPERFKVAQPLGECGDELLE